MTLQDKRTEITEYAMERIEDAYNYDPSSIEDIHDLHHELFNTNYYIIGRYQAKQWLGEDTFDCIATVRDYEEDNFGQLTTDISEPERVVNMYTYIIGEEILAEAVEQFLENQASS